MSDGFEWLDWLEPSGPFLAAPVLKKAFPQGLDLLDPNKKRTLRRAYEEYRQALDEEEPEADKFQAAWIALVLREGLEYDEDESGDNLKTAEELGDSLVSQVAEHGVTLQPDYAVVDDQRADRPMMLIQVHPEDVDLNDAVRGDGWASSPKERMVRLCRDTGTRLGLVTNGEHWLFVDAPVGAVSSFANWYARLWGQESVLLQTFVALLGIRRFFVGEEEQLPALIDKSVEFQDEVTEALGEQVRRAVEVLIQALDKADLDRNRALLKDVDPRELYEAGLTVMMRLVFLLSAEERDLLLLGDERYEANYAVSTLRMQLRGEDDSILQRGWDAWSRLLAIFRAIYGGIEHETLRMPALGGSLFDPDRFPFLEGRDKDSSWKTDPAKPLPIDNQTVLLLLDAIQLFEGRTLSYRGLDIEQLGYVYEGLLDHTVKRAKEVTLELDATKSAKQPWVTLGELESARLDSDKAVEKLLKERTGSAVSRVRNDLNKAIKPEQSLSLLTACHNERSLHDQLQRFFNLIRTDSWGRPLVYPEGSFIVTTGEDRRQTGSHYTPTSLTEAIVKETLEPVVYAGPAEGKPREEWRLKSPEELLDLKICDPAMGSGAFLVQVCRWLGERVVEAWVKAEESGRFVGIDGSVTEKDNGGEPMPRDVEERTAIARRLIAERCIYGVDLNPLAVELAKLSIWLVTLSKGRPFGYLDHNLRSGDSLLGVHDVNQLHNLSMDPRKGQKQLFAQNIRYAVDRSVSIRNRIATHVIHDIQDVTEMAALDIEARETIGSVETIADAFVGEALLKGDSADFSAIAVMAGEAIDGESEQWKALAARAIESLSIDLPSGKKCRRPFHWALKFPEVFCRRAPGFDAIVGNPPFMGGQKISGVLGSAYREYLVDNVGRGVRGSADLVSYFYLFAFSLLRDKGCFGLIASNTIAQGDTREVGLEQITQNGGAIYSAAPNIVWPGKASVVVSLVHIYKGNWNGPASLLGNTETYISPYLDPVKVAKKPRKINASQFLVTKGSEIGGSYFLLSESEIIDFNKGEYGAESEFVKWFLNGEDILQSVASKPRRMIINFGDLERKQARKKAPVLVSILEKRLPAKHREKWWQYRRPVVKLYQKVENQSSVIVCGQTGEMWSAKLVPSNHVYSNSVIVFASQSLTVFSIIQSSIHEAWKLRFGPTLKLDPRYSISDVFDTFPFPDIDLESSASPLADLGREYDCLRDEIVLDEELGLTDLYKRFHDPSFQEPKYNRLRVLDEHISKEVGRTYGWEDLDWSHDFNPVHHLFVSNPIRWTIGRETRFRLLRRLVALNAERDGHGEISDEKLIQPDERSGDSRQQGIALDSKGQKLLF